MTRSMAWMAAAVLLMINSAASPAQEQTPFSLSVVPGFEIPLGPRMAASADKPPYSIGYSAGLVGEYKLPFSSILLARGAIDYCLLPVVNGETVETADLSLVSFGLGTGVSFSPIERVTVKASAMGGYYVGVIGGQTGGNLFLSAGAGMSYRVLPALNVGLEATYKYYLTPSSADASLPRHLYDGISAQIGATYNIGVGSRRSKV